MKLDMRVAVCVFTIFWLSPAVGKTYRWVDDNGVTVYSQTPPPSGEATVIKAPPKPAADPGAVMEDLKRRQAEFDAAKKKKNGGKGEADDKNSEIQKQNCEIAKKNLAGIEQYARVRMRQEDGSYKQLTDEERQAEIDKYNKNVKKFCNQ